MSVPTHRQVIHLDLSREEQWVLHHVLLDRIELEVQAPADTDPPPLGVFQVFEKLDTPTNTETATQQFTPCELQCLHEQLRQYAGESTIPAHDQDIAAQLLPRLAKSARSALARNKSS